MAASARASRKIYFCGSIRGGRDDAQVYQVIVKQLKQYGQVFTEHVADPSLVDAEGKLKSLPVHQTRVRSSNSSL